MLIRWYACRLHMRKSHFDENIGRTGQWSFITNCGRQATRTRTFAPTNESASFYRHVCKYDHSSISRIHAQRPCRYCRLAHTHPSMPFPNDLLYSIHGRQCRASEDCAEDNGTRRDAEIVAAEESHGLNHPKQDKLLHQHTEHHSRRSRSNRSV